MNNSRIELDFLNFKLPTFHSFLNIIPWIYLSGGRDSKTSKEINNFFKIKRVEEKKFECVELTPLNDKRSNHTMIHHNNSIYAISGTKNYTCENYEIAKNKWISLPNINTSREKASSCIHNDQFIYVFLGFDRTINKYVSNIERLDITSSSKWEVINVKGTQNLLKKQAMSSVYSNKDNKPVVYLIGGVNALRNETKEVTQYDFDSNSITLCKFTMLSNHSFNHSQFIKFLDDNSLYNFSENFELIKFDPKNLTFT
jgi:hypothetical protein